MDVVITLEAPVRLGEDVFHIKDDAVLGYELLEVHVPELCMGHGQDYTFIQEFRGSGQRRAPTN